MNKQDLIRHIRDERMHKGWLVHDTVSHLSSMNKDTLEADHRNLHQEAGLPFTHPHAG